MTYHSKYSVAVEELLFAVHVPYAISPQPNVMGACAQCAERLLIWHHVVRYGHLPACNNA